MCDVCKGGGRETEKKNGGMDCMSNIEATLIDTLIATTYKVTSNTGNRAFLKFLMQHRIFNIFIHLNEANKIPEIP